MKFIRHEGSHRAAESPMTTYELAWQEMTGELPVIKHTGIEPSRLILGIDDATWLKIRDGELKRENTEIEALND